MSIAPVPADLETRVARIGGALAKRLGRVIEAVPGTPRGPVRLARAIGVDKVLASRVLRAAANRDPVAALRMMPGPEPLRRLSQAAARHGVARKLTVDLETAVSEFEELIRTEAGDRSALDAMLAGWLPEARGEFELRRKQAAYRAMSQLKGASTDVLVATVFVAPSKDDPNLLDLVWVMGLLGLQRLRPGAVIKFATRRVATDKQTGLPRRPCALDGTPVDDFQGLRLDEFSSQPPASLTIHRVGEVMHYALDQGPFGPASATDLVFGEANFRELPRYVPAENPRKRFVFAEVSTPAKRLIFDAFLDRSLRPGTPTLNIYDTAFDGIANVNDPARDIDRMDLSESVQSLGEGIGRVRAAEVPWYGSLLETVCQKLRWSGADLVGWRTSIDYPIYGSQVVMSWDAPVRPQA
jgi:hypothetical protein